MLITPTRYVQKPPEVDALLIADDTVDAACTWLAEHGRDGYRTPDSLHVIGRGQLAGFGVPFGWYLLHDGQTFRTVTAQHFEAAYERVDPTGSHSWRDQKRAR